MAEDFWLKNHVRADWTDLRDNHYAPTLAVLRNTLLPEDWLIGPATDADACGPSAPVFGVRNQGGSGRCAGHALAAMIDIQARHQAARAGDAVPDPTHIVSADMLYQMGAFHDRYPDLEGDSVRDKVKAHAEQQAMVPEGLRSLRSVIKGFYHHGVCLDIPPGACPEDREAHWQSQCFATNASTKSQLFPEVKQAKAARSIGLGAYYRLRPVLNHFHAALNDAGAVLVSANVHAGWTAPFDPAAEGRIAWPVEEREMGTHAFALVGYDREGFLVLNSWGSRWGGYKGIAGVALWPYADWADSVVDAWVLRLGVSAPNAFAASIGEQGANRLVGSVRAGSTPCYELVGHYMHLDDGFQVDIGSYPSFEDGWKNTKKYLDEHFETHAGKTAATPAEQGYRGIVISFPGSLEGIKPAFAKAAAAKTMAKAAGLYPYTVFWCNNFVEKSLEVLTTVFDSCREQAGDDSTELDALIVQSVQGVGRAFWRDIERGAMRAVHGTPDHPEEDDEDARDSPRGYLDRFLNDLLDLVDTHGIELHIVTEGAGALVLHELLRHRGPRGVEELAERLTTLSLVLPAIGLPRAKKRLLPLVEAMNARVGGTQTADVPAYDARKKKQVLPEGTATRPPPPARIYVAHPELETRIGFGAYGKSILELVSRAFEDRLGEPGEGNGYRRTHPRNPPRRLLGMAAAQTDLAALGQRKAASAFSRLMQPSDPRFATGKVPQTELSNDPAIPAEIFRTIALYRTGAQTEED